MQKALNRSRGSEVKAASDLFSSIVPGKRWQVYLPRRIIWQKWEELVGKQVADATWPWYFQDLDCLVIAVSDNLWMQQLSYESPTILERINRLLPDYARLSRLRFHVADPKSVRARISTRTKKDRSAGRDSQRMKRERATKASYTDELNMLENIEDPELRKHFENILKNIS